MSIKKIMQCDAAMKRAEKALRDAVREMYPDGTRILFTMQARQKNLSEGVVWTQDYTRAGFVRVHVNSKTRHRTKGHVRDVHYSDIDGVVIDRRASDKEGA